MQNKNMYNQSHQNLQIQQNYHNSMSNQFFSIETLESGTKLMVQLIKDCAQQIYGNKESLVLPNVQPGFLRHQLPETAPQQSQTIQHLIQMTKIVIFPGTFKWQSPKFFGYYPSSINVTNIFADMFAVINQTPNFSFAVSPAFTQLENTMVDWSAKALGLPEKFLLANTGGGIINNSATQSIFSSVHIAKFAKMKELNILGNNPQVLKFVGYFGQGSHISSQRALTIKDIFYRRPVPYIYNPTKLNYDLDIDKFVELLEQDLKNGLIPFWFGFSYGNTFCAAIDIDERVIQICKKHKIWINVDAAFLGSAWISEKYRPSKQILQGIDSIDINFSKLLLNGTGGSLFYVSDKKILTQSFGASTLKFSFYKNQFTGNYDVTDYKDWIVGLGRRNNALKLYYTFVHYGMKKIREAIQSLDSKTQYLIDLVLSKPDLFKIFTTQYAVVTFQVLGKDNNPSNEITKKVNSKIHNIKQGFSSPGQYRGTTVIRIVVGQFHTTHEHLKAYFQSIVAATKQSIDEI